MKRIEVLDLWRSFAIVFMCIFHFAYDLMVFGVLPRGAVFSPGWQVVRYLAVCSFILISGMVSRYSRSNIKRGFVVFCVGVAVAFVTGLFDQPIRFGVLHFFGCAMIIYGLIREKVNGIRTIIFPAVCMLLFAVTFHMYQNIYVDAKFLYPLGLRPHGFYSSDYYPLMPWFFLFLAGVWLGGVVQRHRDLKVFNLRIPSWLTFIGRHSLEVYVIHQPIFYGFCWLIWGR